MQISIQFKGGQPAKRRRARRYRSIRIVHRPDQPHVMKEVDLERVSNALRAYPRTVLRLLSGQPNPNWSKKGDPGVDMATLALMLGSSDMSIQLLLDGDDFAFTVKEAAKMLRVRMMRFYHMNLVPDWQVGRAKRYSFNRIAKLALERKARAK